MVCKVSRHDMALLNILQCRGTHEAHAHLHLSHQNVYDFLGSLLTIRANAVKEWTAKATALGTECQALEDIRSTSDSTIYKHIHLVLKATFSESIHNFIKYLNTTAGRVDLSTTMVRAKI